MRILHATANPGNQGMKLSRAQRKLGYDSDCLVGRQGYANFGADIDLRLDRANSLVGSFRKFIALCRCLTKYDVFHFHSVTFINPCIDIVFLRILRKKVIFHCHGVELIRALDPERAKTLYGGEFSFLVKIVMKLNIHLFTKFSNTVLVSEPDLLVYIPKAVWIPQPTDLDYWSISNASKSRDRIVRIAHAPSDKQKKGTKYIIFAVNELKRLGYKIELEVIHGIPYTEVKPRIQEADIFIDQLLAGWYGNAAVEALALKKPVCAYIRDDMVGYLGDCPIVNANSSNLAQKLQLLIENRSLRKQLGVLGRKYVEKYHNTNIIAKKLVEIYVSV